MQVNVSAYGRVHGGTVSIKAYHPRARYSQQHIERYFNTGIRSGYGRQPAETYNLRIYFIYQYEDSVSHTAGLNTYTPTMDIKQDLLPK